ncbi:DUF2442 domain-containing protein [Neobacillus citreus]|uniref:DUF2442 domain-containing protein n=1 Tax=Neobacillus citreus TaxID=2833578 RepID=A0A942YEP7_9BACI|nr:DUF2442 domain-containing protein [Neobacillus citreus]MCH6265079.1 DUF2442 domain-containing protein [Neobacillus citreus]
MKILSFYPTKSFKLIMEFENQEYRLLDTKEFLKNEDGLLQGLCNDINLFMTAELDEITGNIKWRNGVEFEPESLYNSALDLDRLKNRQKKGITPRKITRLPEDYKSKISIENAKLLKLLRRL